MSQLIFIEGVSGVGKSTMVRMLSEELQRRGYTVQSYLEFDYTNPIDFYCTAYLSEEEYEKICRDFNSEIAAISQNTITAGKARLVRYCNEDTPLFGDSLQSVLLQKEFCYHPEQLVPLKDYTSAYAEVWHNYAQSLNDTCDFIIFDGSLLHHPINDMMRNYHITGEQATEHVTILLKSLGAAKRQIFYLKTESITDQLKRALSDRGQGEPTNEEMVFWQTRYENDMIVLRNIQENYHIFDVSNDKWNLAREQMIEALV